MANFRFRIEARQRVNPVGTIFKFDVRTPGMTLHNMRLLTGKKQPDKPYPDIHLDYPKGTKGSEAFGVTFPPEIAEMIRQAAIVALADWTAEHGQHYPPELLTASERMGWLNQWRESTRLSPGDYVEVSEGLNDLDAAAGEEAGNEF
jgi:hypothetical protein